MGKLIAENLTVVAIVWDIAIVIAVIVILWFAYRWWKKRPAKPKEVKK